MVNISNQLVNVFGIIPQGKLESLAAIFSIVRHKAGENVYFQGDDPDALYIVADGRLKIVRTSRNGEETILCIREAGDIFCPVPILDGGSQLGTAAAITDIEILKAKRDDFIQMSKEWPEILNCVQGDCLGEVRRLLRRIESFAFHSVRERLCFYIYEEVKKIRPGSDNGMEIQIKQQDLAGMIGASRESVTRELSKLQKQGVLQVLLGKLVIIDAEKLKLLAEIE